MNEIIISITEFFEKSMHSHMDQKEIIFDGFEIVTNLQTIYLAIGNEQQCCEDVGYFMTNDNLDEFVGSQLNSIDWVDGELKTHTVQVKVANIMDSSYIHTYDKYVVDLKKDKELGAIDNYALFVNLHTNKGVLQFVAYNAGNGYYGHAFELVSQQKNYSTLV